MFNNGDNITLNGPFNALKPMNVQIVLKHFAIAKINRLMLFKEITAVCSEVRNIQILSVGKTHSYWLLNRIGRVIITGLFETKEGSSV